MFKFKFFSEFYLSKFYRNEPIKKTKIFCLQQKNELDSSEESEEEGDGNNYVMVYSIIFFFNLNENDKSTNAIFSLSNIFERRLIRNN